MAADRPGLHSVLNDLRHHGAVLLLDTEPLPQGGIGHKIPLDIAQTGVQPEFAEFLVNWGIDSISLNPDSVLKACRYLSGAEGKIVSGDGAGSTALHGN